MAGKKVRAPRINTVPAIKKMNCGVSVGNVPAETGTLFGGKRPSNGEQRNKNEVSSAQHRQRQCQVKEWRVCIQTCEGAAVGGGGSISVEEFRKPMRPIVGETCE